MNDPLYVSIIRDICAIRDVSADEEERSKALHVPELSSAFEALGFRSIGVYRMGRAPALQHTHEVWRSPDSRAFLTVEYDQRQKPRAELRTLLHDGTIVDTSSHFSGLARLFRRSRIHHPESAMSGFEDGTAARTRRGLCLGRTSRHVPAPRRRSIARLHGGHGRRRVRLPPPPTRATRHFKPRPLLLQFLARRYLRHQACRLPPGGTTSVRVNEEDCQ
jgi:hypothetical protein